MMFIDEDQRGPFAAPILPAEVELRDLLAACAAEARRQAKAAAHLDGALGAALRTVVRGVDSDAHLLERSVQSGAARSAATSALQQADLFRQEMAGLAQVLDLVVEFSAIDGKVPADRVRACTPLHGLQHRLLAPQDSPV